MVHLIDVKRLEKKLKEPLYLELEQMLSVLDSLKEESKLWASKYKRNGVDLFVSSIILWFTYDTYKKLGLEKEVNASLEALKNLLMLNLKDQSIGNLNPSDLLEIFQCIILLLERYNKNRPYKFLNKLAEEFNNEERYLEKIIHTYNPFETHLSSLIILIMIYFLQISPFLNFQFNSQSVNMLDYYFEKITENTREYVEPSALYWITEVLLKISYMTNKKYININTMMGAVKHIESLIIKNLDINNLDNIPLDRLLWYYHSIENYMELMNKLKEPISLYMKKLHKNIMELILKKGFSLWISSSYGNVFRNIRTRSIYHFLDEYQGLVLDIDLITLSLLIGAYDRSGKHIVTYITEYDLRKIKSIEKISFFIGSSLTVLGSMLLMWTIITIITRNAINFVYIFFEGSTIIYGIYITYSLVKGKIKTLRDLVEIVINIIKRLF